MLEIAVSTALLNRPLSQPAVLRWLGFAIARPWRRGVAEEAQRRAAIGAELEPPTRGYGQGVAWAHRDRGNGVGFGIG